MHNSISELSNGKPSINPKIVFVEYMRSKKFRFDFDIEHGLKEIESILRAHAEETGKKIEIGAINKCNGDWYEWFIALRSIEFFTTYQTDTLLISLPNVSAFDVISLYTSDLSNYIFDLRKKLSLTNVNLITSNPDFCIVRLREEDIEKYRNELADISFNNLTIKTLDKIDSLYHNFVNYAGLDDIAGYLSVKASLRPDRRLQLAHEGSLMKALYTHLQTRTWTINPRGIRYFAASKKISEADIKGLKTVATHSIIDVKSSPQSAVDELFQINTVNELDHCLTVLLSS